MAGMGTGPGAQPGMKGEVSKDSKSLLNTYIHNYLIHEGQYELAKAVRESSLGILQGKLTKENDNNRQVNGADDSMDTDSKDGINRSNQANNALGDNFLLDYWFIFWDMWAAARLRGEKPEGVAAQYLAHTQNQSRMAAARNSQLLQQPGMMAGAYANGYRGGMVPTQFNLQKTAMANNGRNMNPSMQNIQRMSQMQQQQLQREGAELDANGQPRPQSPVSAGENAPSPKRKRAAEGAAFNGNPQMGGPSRAQMLGQLPNGASGNAAAMLMQSGVDPKTLSPAQMSAFMGQKPDQQLAYSQGLANQTRAAMNNQGLPNGLNGGGMGVSPTMMPDGQNVNPEFFSPNTRGGTAPNGGALADYQMQLMLLEQQNKKRLMMARQEQDVAAHHGQAMMGQPGAGAYAPAMSPRGSRTGQSPGSNELKRGTPKMGQNSPLPDGSMPQNRSSPGAPNFDTNQMQANMPAQYAMQMKMASEGMVGPNGNMVRPPMNGPNNLNPQMDMLRQQSNGGRMPNGTWPGGQMPTQMGAQAQGQQQGQGENNQQRGNMPPPQAPPAGGNNGRSQPSPTQQPAAPPTPNQNSKTAKKKDSKDTKKKPPKNKAASAAGATSNAESERAPTPTPQTPITPVNPESVLIKGQHQGGAPTTTQAQSAASNAPAPANMAPTQEGNVNVPPFGNIDNPNDIFNMNDSFSLDNSDVLEGFDFDSFLQDPSVLSFDPNETFAMPGEGVETGAGDQ